MLTKELEKLGLNSRESRVYLALLQLGEATMQDISAQSGVKRTTVYGIIKSLKEKGLLKIVIGQKKILYCAHDPKKFEESLKEKQSVLEKIMPQLLTLTASSSKKTFVSFFKDEQGINDIYRDILFSAKEETLVWSTELSKKNSLWSNFWEGKDRKERHLKIIISGNEHIELHEKPFFETRQAKNKLFPVEVDVILYAGNKTVLISPIENIGIIIESEKVFNTLKGFFVNIWETLNC